MPLQLGRRTAVLSGTVTVDEAEPLAGWLRSTGDPRVDLKDCEHLHTAALQALMAGRVKVSAEPADAFLRTWVVPVLEALHPATGADGAGVPENPGDPALDTIPAPTLEEVAP